jgi:hypothetical protein
LPINLTDYGYAAQRQIIDTTDAISGLAQSRSKTATFAPVLTMTRGERWRKARRHGCANCNGEQRHYTLINIKLVERGVPNPAVRLNRAFGLYGFQPPKQKCADDNDKQNDQLHSVPLTPQRAACGWP